LADRPADRPPWRLLAALADPEAPPPSSDAFEPAAVASALSVAGPHGVLPIVRRKLRAAGFDPGRLDETARPLLADASERLALEVGQTMILRHHQRRVMAAFAEARLAAVVVKGPVFAGRLYPIPTDRYFSDIDILVAEGGITRANAIVGKLGFELEKDAFFDTSARKREYQWLLAGNRSVLVELHGNLVHHRALRRRVSLGYAQLVNLADSVAGMLVVAIVHASCGHKFHRLLFLVDILQAVRALPDDEVPIFEAAVRRLGIALETTTALGLAGAAFSDERVLSLASRFSPGIAGRLGLQLVTPAAVVDALPETTVGSRLRRHAFRWLQISPLARA